MKKTSSEWLKNEIIRYIVRMGLRPDEKLPSERELSEMFSVSRTTVREAVKMLEEKGIVKVEAPKGIFVSSEPHELIFEVSFSTKFAPTKNFIIDLLRVRGAMEELAVELTIMNSRDAEIFRAVEDLKTLNLVDPDQDMKFHRRFFEMSGNAVLMNFFEAFNDLLSVIWHPPFVERTFGRASLPYHKDLLQAIADRNLHSAKDAVRKIIETDIKILISS
ncbi:MULTISPECIES: FadR/GntR family transcriptional regulator [Pseudothermotoga]|jgi:DNA-binding FadR family transcriptional regulator|nr:MULTISPECIES: FCD domain-containing protein [Pseudothermotoga]MDI3495832.1 GntR family transcriptional regulator, transcriptional repressor for pyruvate dehydrogenase complex [Pseudothermotoga sp.]MDK2885388.1 GntR family transcriptional regulator, transcriptional repressor for pyruvate dehydrogenase complex [Pseudothermotoga sp.]GLI49412.1 GntR family transcriptional regulator [Pseudothermotoga lettingae TMO]